MPELNPEIYRGLSYPYGRKINPEPGQVELIAEGVYWVRVPMPMSLDHINIWLLEDDDGWTARTLDGGLSAHFEACVAVTANGPRMLGVSQGGVA